MGQPMKGTPQQLDDICHCDAYGSEDEGLEHEFDEEDNLRCPRCGGRVISGPPPISMEEEEDDV